MIWFMERQIDNEDLWLNYEIPQSTGTDKSDYIYNYK